MFDEFDYEMNEDMYHYIKFYYSDPMAKNVLTLIESNEQIDTTSFISFTSEIEFFCGWGILLNETCIIQETTNYSDTNASEFTNH